MKTARASLTVGTVIRRGASFASLATMWVAGFRVLGDAKGSAYLSLSHKFSANGFTGLVRRRTSRDRGV